MIDTARFEYGAVAARRSNSDTGVRAVAEAFGYSAEELESIPARASMGLSCGNPTATASLRPGEVVVDLGSGNPVAIKRKALRDGPQDPRRREASTISCCRSLCRAGSIHCRRES